MPCLSYPAGVCIHPLASPVQGTSGELLSPLPLPNKSDCRKRLCDPCLCSCHKTDGYQTKLRHKLLCSLCVHPPVVDEAKCLPKSISCWQRQAKIQSLGCFSSKNISCLFPSHFTLPLAKKGCVLCFVLVFKVSENRCIFCLQLCSSI